MKIRKQKEVMSGRVNQGEPGPAKCPKTPLGWDVRRGQDQRGY